MVEPKGYPEKYSWVGKMPDGTERRFATEAEYLEEFRESLNDTDSS